MKYSINRFVFSIILLIVGLYFLIINPIDIVNIQFYYFIPFWLFFIYDIWKVILPKLSNFSPYGKLFRKFYREAKKQNLEKMKEHLKKTNLRATLLFFGWILFLVIIGFLYSDFLTMNHIIFLVLVLNFFDYFSINIWCPFHKIIIRDKCCNTCRIYNWDHFLKFSPFYLIPTFWTYSLLLSSIIALIQWELLRFVYPERFTEFTNDSLSCSNCLLNCRFNKKNSYQQ